MGNFSRELETKKKKTKLKIIELKNTLTKIKNSLDKINNILEIAEKKTVSKLEDRAIEVINLETIRGKQNIKGK